MFRLVTFVSFITLALGANIPVRRHGRIVGGSQVDITEHPYQVALELSRRHICGASIIGERVVVTAAQCTEGIRAGTSQVESGGAVHQISTIFQHPQFGNFYTEFDVAVLILAEPLTFSDSIKPIVLAEVVPAPGTDAITSRWGALNQNEWGTDYLQAVTVPIVSQQVCRKAYGEDTITDNMICAGFAEGGKDACQGDSGGPLVAKGEPVGIVSWGAGCARPGYPGVYTSVAALHQFIVDSAGHA